MSSVKATRLPAAGNLEFLQACECNMPKGKKITAIRADSAAYQAAIFNYCDVRLAFFRHDLRRVDVERIFSLSSMTLYSAAPPDRILTRSPQVTACRGRHLAPRLNQSLSRRMLTVCKRDDYAVALRGRPTLRLTPSPRSWPSPDCFANSDRCAA
jgi:hypothetical protein